MKYQITGGTPALHKRREEKVWKGCLTQSAHTFSWYERREKGWLVFSIGEHELKVPERFCQGFNLPPKPRI